MRILTRFLLTFFLLTALSTGVSTAYAGNELPDKGVMIKEPWARPTPPVAANGAAYISIHNMGSKQDRLVSARSKIANMVQIHDHIMEDGLMKMQHLVTGVAIAEGEMVEFAPGGKHLMLMGLNEPLVAGDSFEVILNFEIAGEKAVTVEIREMDTSGDGGHSGHSGHDSQSMEQGG